MEEKKKLNLNFYTWEEIKKIFFDKKFDNVILFSQPRSGSTFVSNLLAKELNYEKIDILEWNEDPRQHHWCGPADEHPSEKGEDYRTWEESGGNGSAQRSWWHHSVLHPA